MGSTILREVHPSDRAQLDAKGLKEYGEDIGHEYDEKKFVFKRGACGDVGSVISYSGSVLRLCLNLNFR